MKNETVTLSRELAEKIPEYMLRGVKGAEDVIEALRAALAEPVPHAGEEVDCEVCHGSGVLPGLTVKVTKCSYCGNGWKTIANLATTNLQEFKEDHQSELTKARELLKGLCNNRNYPIGYATQQEVEVFLARQSAPAEEEHEHPY